jgi:hypothetical protein
VTGAGVFESGTPREYTIDPETLRDVPSRPAALAGWLGAVREVPVPLDPVAQRRHRTEIGVAARQAGDLELAERELSTAAVLAALESPRVAVRARIRLARVWHWQGRYREATTELASCVEDAATPADRAFAHQHAGECAFDRGHVDLAAAHFQAALRLGAASGARPAELAASRTALDAADACRTAIAAAAELDRLVPSAHHRIREVLLSGDLLPERPPHFGVLVELRTLLLAGPVPTTVVAELFRYGPGIRAAVGDLAATGWLACSANAVAATPRCRAVLSALMSAAGITLVGLWGAPDAQVSQLHEVVRGAIGTSAGPVFDALATVDVDGPAAVRLFELCNALRHHRADGHAAAWRAFGLTATSVAAVPKSDPVRRDVETTTNRIAARVYRPLSTVRRSGLVTLLRHLPD